MECILSKIQYVRKLDVKFPDAILACRQFQEKKTRFQQACIVHHYR